MDLRWNPCSRDSRRDVRIYLHPIASMEDVRRGAADLASSAAIDCTDMVSSATQTQSDATITLNWNNQLFGATQPKPNQIIEVRLLKFDSPPLFQTLWIGIIESIGSFTMSRGERSMTLTVRTRETQPIWKDTKRVTPLFPQLTEMSYIGRQVAKSVGMEDDEIIFPGSAFTTSHTNTQLADMSAWEMLTNLFLPMGWTPFIDGLGRLRVANRQLQSRTPDIIVEDWQVVKVTAQRQKPPATRVRLRWLNPTLTRAVQQGRKLVDYTMTMGWFLPYLKHDIWFSDDKTQRATDTYMVVRQSCNSFFGKGFVIENYTQLAENEGKISLINVGFYLEIVALIAAKVAASYVGDIVPVTGATIPLGRRIEAIADEFFMVIMLSIGTGIYEIWGTPFEWVHARNTTEAFDSSAPLWIDNGVDVSSDFIINEQHATAVATQELIYQAWGANKWQVTLVDNPQIEYGDILQFPDGSKIFVEGFSRSLTRGSEATLQVNGFLLGGSIVAGTPTTQAIPPVLIGSGTLPPEPADDGSPGSKSNPIIAMSADPAQIARDVRASLAFYGRTDDAYWIGAVDHLSNGYSDRLWRIGWNRYHETRADPSNTGVADVSLANLPAIHT